MQERTEKAQEAPGFSAASFHPTFEEKKNADRYLLRRARLPGSSFLCVFQIRHANGQHVYPAG